jgi:CubicO group peptidase (beta-lactamase class C family)
MIYSSRRFWPNILVTAILLSACGSDPASSSPTPQLANDPLPMSTPEAAGWDRRHWDAALALVAKDLPRIDSIVLTKGGTIVAETHYNGYSGERLHDLRSTTKSITALLVGAAIDRGAIRSVDMTVESFFPDHAAHGSWKSQRPMTLKDLLTMRTGLDCDDWLTSTAGWEERMYRTSDWIDFFFSIPNVEEPGSRFSYCTAGVVVLGEIVSRAMAKPLPLFAQEVLFEPLGIRDAKWAEAPKGVTDAGGHVQLSVHSLTKIGLLVHQRGLWKSKQVVSDTWIAEMLKPHTAINRKPFDHYGFLWWLASVRDGVAHVFHSQGNGGQIVVAVPDADIVVAFTGSAFDEDAALAPFTLTTRYFIPMALGKPFVAP